LEGAPLPVFSTSAAAAPASPLHILALSLSLNGIETTRDLDLFCLVLDNLLALDLQTFLSANWCKFAGLPRFNKSEISFESTFNFGRIIRGCHRDKKP